MKRIAKRPLLTVLVRLNMNDARGPSTARYGIPTDSPERARERVRELVYPNAEYITRLWVLGENLGAFTRGDNNQPTTCPRCGARTNITDEDDGVETHTCLNPECAATFTMEED